MTIYLDCSTNRTPATVRRDQEANNKLQNMHYENECLVVIGNHFTLLLECHLYCNNTQDWVSQTTSEYFDLTEIIYLNFLVTE